MGEQTACQEQGERPREALRDAEVVELGRPAVPRIVHARQEPAHGRADRRHAHARHDGHASAHALVGVDRAREARHAEVAEERQARGTRVVGTREVHAGRPRGRAVRTAGRVEHVVRVEGRAGGRPVGMPRGEGLSRAVQGFDLQDRPVRRDCGAEHFADGVFHVGDGCGVERAPHVRRVVVEAGLFPGIAEISAAGRVGPDDLRARHAHAVDARE